MCGGGPDGRVRVCGDNLQHGCEVPGADWYMGCERSDEHVHPFRDTGLWIVLDLLRLQRGHLGMGHVERDDNEWHVRVALAPCVDARGSLPSECKHRR